MSVNYKLIADNDPGGDLETAFNTLASETVITTPETMITYRKIAASVSLTATAELEQAISALPLWVNKALQTDGIDVNDPQTAAALSSLVSTETAASIIALGKISTQKYPGLKLGHLQNAREMRAEGKI